MNPEYEQLLAALENEDPTLFAHYLKDDHNSYLAHYLNDMVCYDRRDDARRFIRVLKKTDKDRVKDLVGMFSKNSSGSASKAMLKLALNAGGDVNGNGVSYQTPLYRYLDSVAEDNVKLLLKYNPDPDLGGPRQESTLFPLVMWWSREYFDKFQFYFDELMKLGANINHRNKDQENLLHVASHDKNVKTVKFLLERGIDIDALNIDGETALMIALRQNATTTANALIAAGAELMIEDRQGMNAINLCAQSSGLKSVKTRLRKLGYELPDSPPPTPQAMLKSAENLLQKFQALAELLTKNRISLDERIEQALTDRASLKSSIAERFDYEVDLDDVDALDLFDMLSMLMPEYFFECPVEPFSAYQQDELISVYTDILNNFNQLVGADPVLKNISGVLSEGMTKISFEGFGEHFEQEYRPDSSYLDVQVLEDIDQLAEDYLSGRFLMEMDAEYSIRVFYLPEQVCTVLTEVIEETDY